VSISDGCTFPGASTSFTVNVNPTPTATFVSTINKGCAPFGVNFTAVPTTSNNTGLNYVWDFGNSAGGGPPQTGPQAFMQYPNAGTYNAGLTVISSFGCSSDFLVANYVEVYPVPFAEFTSSPQTATILEPHVQFTNLSQGAATYLWEFGDYASLLNTSSLVHPEHTYSLSGFYTVYMVAVNSFGCKDTAIHKVEIKPDFSIYIPNAFTPDQNNRNDVFQPKGVGINEEKYKMEIFDRWGELIFTSNAFRTGWDGTVKGSGQIAQEGVYIYKIFATDLEGNKKYYTGHVTLLKQ
jgi:gliding motility-associated-like protein